MSEAAAATGVGANDPSQSATGIVADLEIDATEDPIREAAADILEESGHGHRAIALALTQKGVRENPPGSNRNPYSAYFGFGPQFWCADFVSWAFDRTGDRNRRLPWGGPSAVVNITQWGLNHHYIVRAPERGAIFTYKNGAHTGMIISVNGSAFDTIEGNTTGPNGQTTWVWSHSRRDDGSYYFIRYPD